MDEKSLQLKLREHYTKQLPFVVYAAPEETSFQGLFQPTSEDVDTKDFSKSGFVFAPFNDGERLFIPREGSESCSGNFSEKITAQTVAPMEVDTAAKSFYISLVQRAIKSIAAENHSKIVTSRCQVIPLSNFDLDLLLTRIFGLHQSAFRFIWFHPSSGIWCGATPEVLLKTNGIEFSTMALAGTQNFRADREPRWESKEIDEQKWVVDAITTKLESAASVIRVSSTRNHKAGTMVHLRTDFNGVFKKGCANVARLVDSLHPTPAVCGTPDDKAMEFILQNENYSRQYYAGFLGPVDSCGKQSTLYVNLRCMQIDQVKAHLFVGGGITIDSNPEAEWKETENKLQTMLQVIAPML